MSTPALSRSAVDRAAQHRRDDAWLAQAWTTGRLLVVDDDRRALVEDDGLVWGPTDGYAGERFFLGVDADGTSYWSGVGELPRKLGVRPVTIRDVGALLSDRDAGLYVTAVGLANWHATHRHCPRCGTATQVADAGWVRRCPNDGSDHFPRTDPAVIVLIHDGADRCLLGRQPSWPPGRYSTLAGFVEPGESLEQAVAREIVEESGVLVGDIVYRGSQPWPFPASLMLGFEARAVGGDVGVGDHELEDVRWFTRDDLRASGAGSRGPAASGHSPLLPPPASIAHWLITTWLARSAH
ncbi:MAG TPA: NAD(+) diphosphatase [Mycobacteriales bacterium]|nr:NAD(+) diphosphatase [Mycobacteriales bacterium]